MISLIGFFLSTQILSAHAFNESAYKIEDLKKYSLEKVSTVKSERKEDGVSESIGFSFNTAPGGKIQTTAITKGCQTLSHGNENFLKVATDMSVLPSEVKKIAGKECSLNISKEVYTVITQNDVAEYINSEAKKGRTSGTAFLLYLGVSNEQPVYLLNKFEVSKEKTVL
ncbi:hypothetical protein D3C87_1175420 [compost metagenome]